MLKEKKNTVDKNNLSQVSHGELLAFRALSEAAFTDGTVRVSASERKQSVCGTQIRLQSRVKTSEKKMRAFTSKRASERFPFHSD